MNCVFIYPESSFRTFVIKTQVQFLVGKVLHLYKDTRVKTYKEAEFTFQSAQRNNLERNGWRNSVQQTLKSRWEFDLMKNSYAHTALDASITKHLWTLTEWRLFKATMFTRCWKLLL